MSIYNYKRLVYKDKSWCASSQHCAIPSCIRYLSAEDELKAEELGLQVDYGHFHGSSVCKSTHHFCDCGGLIINKLCNWCGHGYLDRVKKDE